MEYGQHTTQSRQPVWKKDTWHICTPLCFRTTLIPNAAPPRKGRDSVKLTALSTEITRNTQNWEEAQFRAAPPMHQIQPNGSIKDYSRHTDINKKHKLKTSKVKHPEEWNKNKHRSERKLYYSKTGTLYFAFMNIVLEIYKLITALQNSKLRMHLKQELVLTQRVSPCKLETVLPSVDPSFPTDLK